MRFIVIVKANPDSEAGVLPPPELFQAMHRFNREMIDAGVMLAGEGLHPTTKGARIRFGGAAPVVTQGPFALTGDTIAGFWLIKVKSKDEALAWMKRAPFGGGEIELRQVYEAEDFGAALPDQVKQGEAEQRRQLDQQKKAS